MYNALHLIHILIVDDSEDDFLIVCGYINKIQGNQKFVIHQCREYKKALEEICLGNYDICFVEYRLGAKTGIDLIKEAIKNDSEESLILLTNKGSRGIDIKAMEAGAFDYLIKAELNTAILEKCIRYALERNKFIHALKTNEQKFMNIFERSKDAVFLTDEKLIFKEVNDATCKLLQLSADELLHVSLFELLANKEDRVLIENNLRNKGEVKNIEVELYTKDKDNIGMLSISRQTDINERPFMQGIIHDITHLRKSEKARLQAEKLKVAGRLVQTLAHEVRNPLNNINLSLEQLSEEIRSENVKVYLDIIKRNSGRIANLITELLNSSRPIDDPLEKISLQSVVEKSIEEASDRIKLNHIKLETNYTNCDSFIMGNISKLKIAFSNIIINAIEAMKKDTGILAISIIENDFNYKLSIADNGCGINEETLSHLFEPFFTSKRNGMGLGLAATLNILHSHKARVDVKSKEEVGTTITLAFEKA